MEEEILTEFLAESWENLSRLDQEIVDLEKQPRNAELLGSIFRTIHTIKGTCGFIGLTGLGAVAHSVENVLGQMREGNLEASPATISMVLQGVDRIREQLARDLDAHQVGWVVQRRERREVADGLANRVVDHRRGAETFAAVDDTVADRVDLVGRLDNALDRIEQ